MQRGKTIVGHFRKLREGCIFLICLLVLLIISPGFPAEVLVGKVTSVQGNAIEVNLGSEKGIKSGDSGRIYYTVKVGEQEKAIYVARFKITYLSEKSAMAQIEERTREIKVGYLVEIAFKAGELEIRSDPPRSKVFVDGGEVGESPVILSEMKVGRYQIRIAKQGYEPWSWDVTIEAGKKLEVLAKLERKQDIDWAQKKFEAPVLNVGDQWTYKDIRGFVWTDEILDDKEGLYILKRRGVKDLFGYDKKTMNALVMIRESGKPVENKNVWRKILDFPIFVGKTWTETMTSIPSGARSEATYVCDFKIEGIEEVNTPAGTFKALKIYYKQTNESSGNSGWARFWYSPEAKTWVKRELEKSSYWARVAVLDAELISYGLK